mgnify:CR=1 FL=1
MNTYNSIVPSEMTIKELESMCGDIQTAKNWGLTQAKVRLGKNKLKYRVDTSRHQDYNQEISNRFRL